MQNNPFHDHDRTFPGAGGPYQGADRPYSDPYGQYQKYCPPWPSRSRGIFRTALMWAAIAVVVMLAFGAVTWAFGLIFGLLAFLFKVALVAFVVAFVWRRVMRRRHHSYDV